jgi:hypothetical protein
MTQTQQKALLFGAVAVIASYVVHFIITDAAQMSFRPAPRPKPKPAVVPMKQTPAPVAVKAAPAPAYVAPVMPAIPEVPPEFAKLVGVWRGRTAIQGRGTCDMRFEMHQKDESDKFAGFTALTCVAAGPLVPKHDNATVVLNQTDPEAAIFTGAVEGDSIRFKMDKVVGVDSNGCAPLSFAVTPFGKDRVAAEWTESSCSGGRMLLLRTVR